MEGFIRREYWGTATKECQKEDSRYDQRQKGTSKAKAIIGGRRKRHIKSCISKGLKVLSLFSILISRTWRLAQQTEPLQNEILMLPSECLISGARSLFSTHHPPLMNTGGSQNSPNQAADLFAIFLLSYQCPYVIVGEGVPLAEQSSSKGLWRITM